MPINRLTAYKIWISDLVTNPYIKTQGEFESNYVEIKDKQVSRVNLIATIVNKIESQDKNYASLVLDDGSEQIRVKTWGGDTKLINNFNIGQTVLVIARIKFYNEELYLLPEVVKQVQPNWEIARKFELLKLYGKPRETQFITPTIMQEEKPIIEEISFTSGDLRKELLNLIEKYEEKYGITLDEIKNELRMNINELGNVLEELIKDGEIYAVNERYRLLL